MANQGEVTYKLNLVNGVPFPPFITQAMMDELRDFTLLADDQFIVSYPKSGTTWMQQIVKLIRTNGLDNGQQISDAIPWLEEEGRGSQLLQVALYRESIFDTANISRYTRYI